MKITVEFDSIMEVLDFADTFGSKKLGSTKGEVVPKTISDDIELSKPVQLHSPDTVPVIQPIQQVPQPPITPVQTPPVQTAQQPVVPQQPVTPPQQGYTPPQPQQIPQNTAPPVTPVQTATQNYTENQLALAASQLIDSGRIKEVQQLLASFGIQALIHLPKEQYGAFATQLRSLGAKI